MGKKKIFSTGSESRYSGLKHRRLQRHLQHLEQYDQDIMDLRPEVQLLRALVIDYIEGYDQFVEALLAWYADQDSETKPRRIPDIQEVGTMLDKVSRIVTRIHTVEQTGSITLSTFHRVMEAMGMIVATYVDSPDVLQLIEDEWKNLPLDVTDSRDKLDQIVEDEEDEEVVHARLTKTAKTTKKTRKAD